MIPSDFVVASFLILTFRSFAASITCPTGYQGIENRCFKVYENAENEVTWRNAKSLCESDEGGHLAFIDDCSIMNTLSNYLINNPPSSSSYWIGATDSGENDAWVWTNGVEVQMGVPFWGTSAPGWQQEPNGDSATNCATVNQNDQYYIHDENCLAKHNPLCEINPTGLQARKEQKTESKSEKIGLSCSGNFVPIGNFCFYFHYNSRDDSTLVTNSDAKNICKDRGGRLATLDNCDLFAQVVDYINTNENVQLPKGASYWIGASYGGTNVWRWDATLTTLNTGCPFWGSNNGESEPSDETYENCALLFADNQYYVHNGECFKLAYPLCRTTPN